MSDRLLNLDRSAVGMAVGTAWPVNQAGLAVLLVAGPPAIGGRARDAHLSRDMGNRTTTGDALDQDQPSGRGQPGVSVDHRGTSEALGA